MVTPFDETIEVLTISTIAGRNEDTMSLNSSSHLRGSIRILTRTLIGDTVDIINDTKSDNTLDIIDSKLVQIAFCLFYTIIFVLGVFGNVLVCYVVFRNKAMQTVTNLFITNLALSDILLCIFAVPLTPMYTFLGRWVFGRLLCHLVPYAQGTSVYISTLTLTSIAIDRFFVVIYPFHPRMKLSTCIFIIVFVWLFSLVVTCPYGLFMSIQTTDHKTYYCEENWPSDRSRKVFGVLTTIFQFLIPFLVIAVCYICVSTRLNVRARSKPGTKNSKREETDRERKRRTNRMLIIMVVIFGISWLPLNLINIMSDFSAQMTEWKYYFVSFFFAHSMAMASTCYNLFLYAWWNENFRKEFKQVLPFFKNNGGSRNNVQLGDMQLHTVEKVICNGNKTSQETLLTSSFNRRPSKKQRLESTKMENNSARVESIPLEGKRISAANIM